MTLNHTSGRHRQPRLFTGALAALGAGGLGASASYLLMVEIAEATMQGLANAPFGDLSASTAVALFLPTTATTLAAVIVLRSLAHPKRGGKLLWIAAWLTIVAFCSSFFSWYFERTESAGETSTYLWAASVLSILVSVVFVAAGLLEIFAEPEPRPTQRERDRA